MQLLRPYCDKLEESRLYDIHNLNGMFGLSSEISNEMLAEAKALNSSIRHAMSKIQEESVSSPPRKQNQDVESTVVHREKPPKSLSPPLPIKINVELRKPSPASKHHIMKVKKNLTVR